MEITKFQEKLNKVDGKIYVIEEEIRMPDSGVYEAPLEHDNIEVSTLNVYTGPKLTGDRIQTYALSTPSQTPWKQVIRIQTEEPVVYITYETDGDTVEAEDVNLLQGAVTETQKSINQEVDRAKEAEAVLDRAIRAETGRATDAETLNADNLAAEITRAKFAEKTIKDDLSGEITRAKAAEQRLSDDLGTETSRAERAEELLADRISAESNRANAAEEANLNAINAEINRASTAEEAIRSSIAENKPNWDDKYTRNEVDNKFSALETDIDWKEAVNTYSDLENTYPSPEDGWTVNVKDTDYTYRWNGTEWIVISANAIPKATQSVDGLLSKEDKVSYDDAYNKRHEHSNKSILDKLTQVLLDNWNAAFSHISNKANPHGVTKGQVGLGNVPNVTTNDQTPTFTQATALGNISSGEKLAVMLGKISKAVADFISHKTDMVLHITETERTNWNDAYNKRHTHSNKSVVDKLTQAMLDKLAGIAAEAEVNVQPDWNESETGSDAYIKNKPSAMPASDVASWAKAAVKPAYNWTEIGSKPTSFPPTVHNHTELIPTVTSSNTSLSNSGKFCKLGTMKISSQYGFVSRTYECIIGAHGSSNSDFLRLNLWFKQQAEFGRDPYVFLSVMANDTTIERVQFYTVVDELNAAYTQISLYVKIVSNWTTCMLFTMAKANSSSGTVTYYNDSGFVDVLPATGTITEQIECSNKHNHTKSQITDMPTKVSQFTNDAGYITQDDVDTSQNHTHANKTILDRITQVMLDKWNQALIALPVHTHTKSQITDMPTALKNPYPIRLNGESYDGSAAKDISLLPFVLGTQTAASGTWTGNAPGISALFDGLTIRYWLPYAGSGNATLNLTLADGRATGAIPCYYGGTARLTTHYPAGSLIELTYREAISIAGSTTTYTGWWAKANWNSDSKVSQTNTTGSADYRVLLSANANDTTETNTGRKSTNFLANPSTGEFYAKGYRRIDLTGQTLNINTLTLSAGAPQIMRYIEKTSGGAANITGIPVSGQAFLLDVELIRWASVTDYITMQTFRSVAQMNHEYVRFCTNGTWSSWVTRTFTDTTYNHPISGVAIGTYKSVTVNSQGHVTGGSNPTTLLGYGITDAAAKNHNHDSAYVKKGSVTWADLGGS